MLLPFFLVGFNPLSTGHAPISINGGQNAEFSFNPLSTGHAPRYSKLWAWLTRVSIPYLRVTHRFIASIFSLLGTVSIPYLRVTHEKWDFENEYVKMFQSPIYGSRTLLFFLKKSRKLVSIPYLRVTHVVVLVRTVLPMSVSIPYLRVTHEGNCFWEPDYIYWFQSPIYGSRTPIEFIETFCRHRFQSPIYGSRTPFIPPIRIAWEGFQSPIYGSRTIKMLSENPKLRLFQSPIYGSRTICLTPSRKQTPQFQSPIYGSRTKYGIPAGVTASSFNPLSTGHARR